MLAKQRKRSSLHVIFMFMLIGGIAASDEDILRFDGKKWSLFFDGSVAPVISPANQTSQVITVYIGNGDSVTVSSESGEYTVRGDPLSNPVQVTIPLLKDTTYHLTVSAHVRPVTNPGGCTYGNYTLRTRVDHFGAPLTIVQTTGTHTPLPTPGGNFSVFSPVADTYVSAGNPTANYGTITLIRTDASPEIRSYLRFNVQDVPAR